MAELKYLVCVQKLGLKVSIWCNFAFHTFFACQNVQKMQTKKFLQW